MYLGGALPRYNSHHVPNKVPLFVLTYLYYCIPVTMSPRLYLHEFIFIWFISARFVAIQFISIIAIRFNAMCYITIGSSKCVIQPYAYHNVLSYHVFIAMCYLTLRYFALSRHMLFHHISPCVLSPLEPWLRSILTSVFYCQHEPWSTLVLTSVFYLHRKPWSRSCLTLTIFFHQKP